MHGNHGFSARLELTGHILDSLILSEVLDEILALGGDYEIERLDVGHTPANPSYARIMVKTDTQDRLSRILTRLHELGAETLED
jgi:hypothetical protein